MKQKTTLQIRAPAVNNTNININIFKTDKLIDNIDPLKVKALIRQVNIVHPTISSIVAEPVIIVPISDSARFKSVNVFIITGNAEIDNEIPTNKAYIQLFFPAGVFSIVGINNTVDIPNNKGITIPNRLVKNIDFFLVSINFVLVFSPDTNINKTKPNCIKQFNSDEIVTLFGNMSWKRIGEIFFRTVGPNTIPAINSPTIVGCPIFFVIFKNLIAAINIMDICSKNTANLSFININCPLIQRCI